MAELGAEMARLEANLALELVKSGDLFSAAMNQDVVVGKVRKAIACVKELQSTIIKEIPVVIPTAPVAAAAVKASK